MADLKSSGLSAVEKGSYTVIGILKNIRESKDRNGSDMAFGTLQDYEGDIDLVFFSRVWGECRDLLKLGEFTALRGSVDPESDRGRGKINLKVSSIADLPMLSRSAARKAAARRTVQKHCVRRKCSGRRLVPGSSHQAAAG
jgi:DNA polymerase-3 subunit alpha